VAVLGAAAVLEGSWQPAALARAAIRLIVRRLARWGAGRALTRLISAFRAEQDRIAGTAFPSPSARCSETPMRFGAAALEAAGQLRKRKMKAAKALATGPTRRRKSRFASHIGR